MDDDYDPTNDDLNLSFIFRLESLNAVHIDIPLFSVNREARRNVLTWVQKQGRIELHLPGERYPAVFARKFDSKCDLLYVPLDRLDAFIREVDDRLYEPDLFEKIVHCKCAEVTRLAVPAELFRSKVAYGLADILVTIFIPTSPSFFRKLKRSVYPSHLLTIYRTNTSALSKCYLSFLTRRKNWSMLALNLYRYSSGGS